MQITENDFRNILLEVLKDDFYNYDSFLKIVSIEFTDKIETLAISVEERPKMLVNINFINKNCETIEEVKAVIFHELLHVTLGHNLIISEDKVMALIYNIAFDSIINMIIHKIKGEKYSSVMTNIYSESEIKISYILMPYQKNFTTENLVLDEIWKNLYESNNITQSDVINVLKDIIKNEINVLVIGNHFSDKSNSYNKLKNQTSIEIKNNSICRLGGFNKENNMNDGNDEIFSNKSKGDSSTLFNFDKEVDNTKSILSWKIKIYNKLLKFLDESKSKIRNSKNYYPFISPILSNKDRRGFVRSIWYDSFVFSKWYTEKDIDSKDTNVYIDLSGSMTEEIPYLISVLFKLKKYIKNPFWAFSTKVEKARFKGNRLISDNTGGTSIIPVFEHIKKNKVKKTIIITDGVFENYSADLEIFKPKSQILFVLVPACSQEVIESWGFKYIKLDKINN